MSLADQLMLDLKHALKEGDTTKKETLRLLRAAIKNAEIEWGRSLSEEEILGAIAKQAKQRRDSIAEFKKAGRTDLVDKESAELAVLKAYLPQQLSEAEIRARVEATIAELGVTDMKGMGQVMQRLMSELKGQADGKVVNQMVRAALSGK
ncbi:MAG: GatB/YqeY domain-containing protein [Anaerolineae bacterium]